ncbi:hypothetical protein GW17_00046116 [Ensete ventricosum]|nr:hypothetical protein GW17_00046116 [Ensete ventricosum]
MQSHRSHISVATTIFFLHRRRYFPLPSRITTALSYPLTATTAVNLKIAATISNQSIRQSGDPYIMASIDLIGAKLEVFEMRMEDKLRTLFAEFRFDRSPSPTRSQ